MCCVRQSPVTNDWYTQLLHTVVADIRMFPLFRFDGTLICDNGIQYATVTMHTVRSILAAAGYDGVDELGVNEPVVVERESLMDLHIEKLAADRLSVAHYYTQRGDLMSDPEVVFDTAGDDWTPIEYTQHGFPQVHQYDGDGLDDAAGFVDQWDDTLDDQGFIEHAVKQYELDQEQSELS